MKYGTPYPARDVRWKNRLIQAMLAMVIALGWFVCVPELFPAVTAWPGFRPAGRFASASSFAPVPRRAASGVQLAKGTFLVAGRGLGDPNFSETVILLIEYSQRGALGLVINRPTKVRLATLLPESESLRERPDTVYIGGPVAGNQMLLLIRSHHPPEESYRVLDNVYVSSSHQVLMRLLDQPAANATFQAYAGHAGWAPGQLDHEVSRGDWHILRADAKTIFDQPAAEIWPELIRRSSLKWLRLRQPEGQRTRSASL